MKYSLFISLILGTINYNLLILILSTDNAHVYVFVYTRIANDFSEIPERGVEIFMSLLFLL